MFSLLFEIELTAGETVQSLLKKEIEGKLPGRPLSRAKVTIIRHADRPIDFQSLVENAKEVVNGLVIEGVLQDQSWSTLGAWQLHQRYRGAWEGKTKTIEVLVQALPIGTH